MTDQAGSPQASKTTKPAPTPGAAPNAAAPSAPAASAPPTSPSLLPQSRGSAASTSMSTSTSTSSSRRAVPPPPGGPRDPLSPGTSRRTTVVVPVKPAEGSGSAAGVATGANANTGSISNAISGSSANISSNVHSSSNATGSVSAAWADVTKAAALPTHNVSATSQRFTVTIERPLASPESISKDISGASGSNQASVQVLPVSSPMSSLMDPEPLPSYSYRSPEAVIEHVEEADVEMQPSHLPPGVLEEHFDVGGWGPANYRDYGMDIDDPNAPERSQIGPGVMARRWLTRLHPHPLLRPVINSLPVPQTPKSPNRRQSSGPGALATDGSASASSSAAPPAEPPVPTPLMTLDELYESLPGGKENHDEWFFCPECWGWYRVVRDDVFDPEYPSMPDWEKTAAASYEDKSQFQAAYSERQAEVNRFRSISESRQGSSSALHFHPFRTLMTPTTENRIERVQIDGHVDKFAHLELDEDPERYKLGEYSDAATLWANCLSNKWVFVDKGPVPGQLSHKLVRDFTEEKLSNPGIGQLPADSAMEAWRLVTTLLQNALFRANRGWVKMSNPTFQAKIGASLTSSHLLYQIGFACDDSHGEGYRVGPFNPSNEVSDEHVQRMNQYMARTWVEVSVALLADQKRRNVQLSNDFISVKSLQDELDEWLGVSKIPSLGVVKFDRAVDKQLVLLGVDDSDVPDTVAEAYELQISEDWVNMPQYLGALESLQGAPVKGVDALQLKVATERSLDRYTAEDVDNAYERLGVTASYIDTLLLESRHDISDDHILTMHKERMDNTLDSAGRADLSRALGLVGKDRSNEAMQRIAKNGGVYLSLEQAYQEFSTSRQVDNEMLIMQYETWILDRPSRTDHYRQALSIIADAPGEERPVLQAYLQGKDVSEFQPPARRDIPTGLRNIGNTCYLNSVLQFLYAIKPVREAVMSFEERDPAARGGDESPKEMEQRVKVESSRRFASLLRELFDQMYTCSTKAVVPKEELARLAILPVDLIDQRKDAIPAARNRVTIDSLPTMLSPDSTTASSGAATAAGTPLTASPSRSPVSSRPSVLGKRMSHDRESDFGGSEERLRHRTSPSETSEQDGEQTLVVLDSASPRQTGDAQSPIIGLSQLGITSPDAQPLSVEWDGAADSAEPEWPNTATPEIGPALPPTTMGPPTLPPRPVVARKHSTTLVAAEKFGLQQDAAEILINVLAQLEYALELPSEASASASSTPANGNGDAKPNLISDLFSSKFRQQMLLQSGEGSAAVTEAHPPVESVFVHPIIGVEEDGKDLYDCLAELYLGGAEIEYEGKKGFKMDLIDELPPMLYIQMRRSQYDYAKQSQIKTNTHVPFARVLVMDRFLAGADAEKRERSIALTRDMMRMRAQRHELNNHKPMSIPDTFKFLRDALSAEATRNTFENGAEGQLADTSDVAEADGDGELAKMLAGVDADDVLPALEVQGAAATAEITNLEARLPVAKAELEALWADAHSVQYELVSVFVHGGTGTGGHYWTYQANLPIDGDQFFSYSDDTVKSVGPDEVFADKSASGISPALLCYVRRDRALVDTLHREAAPEETVETVEEQGSGSPRKKGAFGTAQDPLLLL